MPINESLLPEFDHEMANTRRVLERVPEDKFEWRPHSKSPTFIWLASHVTNLPMWAVMTMSSESFDLAPPSGEQPSPPPAAKSRDELLSTFERNRDQARAAIAAGSDQQMLTPWALLKGGHEIFRLPRIAVLRSMVMNHIVHHRAQLCVYLRLNDVPVPGLYGPSADES
jgi:uncharacterized damage-inducible protein DinB